MNARFILFYYSLSLLKLASYVVQANERTMNQRDNPGRDGPEAAENPDNVENSAPINIPTCPAYIKMAKTSHKLSSILQTWLGSTDH